MTVLIVLDSCDCTSRFDRYSDHQYGTLNASTVTLSIVTIVTYKLRSLVDAVTGTVSHLSNNHQLIVLNFQRLSISSIFIHLLPCRPYRGKAFRYSTSSTVRARALLSPSTTSLSPLSLVSPTLATSAPRFWQCFSQPKTTGQFSYGAPSCQSSRIPDSTDSEPACALRSRTNWIGCYRCLLARVYTRTQPC